MAEAGRTFVTNKNIPPMRTTKNYVLALTIGLAIACAAGCGEGSLPGSPEPPPPPATLAEVIGQTNDFASVNPVTVDSSTVVGETNRDVDNGSGADAVTERFACTTRRVSISGGSGEFSLYNPNASVIYPGNLLQGNSLDGAPPQSIPLPRAPGRISYNLINGNFAPSQTVDSVVLSEVRNAQNAIIAESVARNGAAVPANFSLTVESVQSREELAFRLGVKVQTLNASASAGLAVDRTSSRNTVLVSLKQAYYTMSIDEPTNATGFFQAVVTGDQLARYVGPDNPAAYVSSVTYGRVFHMVFTSSSSAERMRAKLNLAFRAFAGSAAGSVSVDQTSELENLSIQVFAYGGADQETFTSVANFSEDNSIRNLLRGIGQSSDIRTGLPISYVVNSVKDPSRVLRVNLATEYDVTNCELKGILPPPGYRALQDIFRSEGDAGGIGAMTWIHDSDLIVFNKAGNRYAWYNGNFGRIEGTWNLDDPNGPIAGTSFSSVGAVVRLNGTRLRIIDGEGLQVEEYTYRNLNGTDGLPDDLPIGAYEQEDGRNKVSAVNVHFNGPGNRSFPFVGQGLTAGFLWRPGTSTRILFNGRGDRYAAWGNDLAWGDVGESPNLFAPANQSTPRLFERVGAAATMTTAGQTIRYLFINEAGDELMEFDVGNNRYSGPWVIN